MRCVNCGEQVTSDARFCATCGSPIEEPDTTRREAETQREADVLRSTRRWMLLALVGLAAVTIMLMILLRGSA